MRPIFCGKVACLIALAAGLAGAGVARAEEAKSVTQYGVTWTFDQPRTVGKFVTGDWWVVGPVNVVSVSPLPGVAPETDKTKVIKNQFGDASFQDDKRMRNGSMIAEKPNPSQGYDSRIINYAAELSVKFPCALKVNQSLISSVSNEDINARNFVENMMWKEEQTGSLRSRARRY